MTDVGYDGIYPVTGFINNILNIYFHEYFPRAASVAQTLRALNSTQRLIYTTHPWLVSLFLDCPPNLVLAGVKLQCPTPDEVAVFTDAIAHGDISWHRGPFNLQPENGEASLFQAGLGIAADLDARFACAVVGGVRLTRAVQWSDVCQDDKARSLYSHSHCHSGDLG